MKNLFLVGLCFCLAAPRLCAQTVKVEEKPLVLPTYEIGAPDVNPIFFTGRVYQGAQGHIYPYPLYDVLTDRKVDHSYQAVYLDNEYVRVCVLPEIGGRILSATDKTNNYEIFYRQTGIKPALIGMLGAWLSGGVEWNIPHHHRPSSYMPIDWKIEENEDGSKTVWVGETELRHRLKWSVGVTVYPGRSWVEARVRIINRTPFIQSLLYWANVSVHCNKDYEVIFPPSTQFGTDHSKVYFTKWPWGETVRGSGKETNLAWWKNYTGNSRSIFAWNFEDDFLAGYDHGKQAGTVHVANRHIVNGKKFFLWGNNPSGEMWNQMLSDKDGHYLELMVGAYSDNQPDYSWIGPGETREFTQRWYGIREIGSVKNANDEAAVNLQMQSPGKVFIGFNTTASYPDAKVLVKQKDRVVFEKVVTISPAAPFCTTVSVPEATPESDLCAVLTDKDGKELIAYQPVVLEEKELPSVVEGTQPIQDYQTVEELYYAGLRVEQFHNARLNAMDFYREALRRDSLDSRVNTVVGIHYAKTGAWDLAEKHLKRALLRPAKDYTVVKDPEPHYYLGVIYHLQGRYKEAADAYWKATWYPTFQHPAYLALAQIATLQNNLSEALSLIDRSLNAGNTGTKALTLKAFLLRKTGRTEEASALLRQVRNIDPLDYWSLAEQSYLAGKGADFLPEAEKQRGEGIIRVQELVEIALDYAHVGAYEEAGRLLDKSLEIGRPYTESPWVYYYSGYYHFQQGEKEIARSQWKKASALSTDGCFPFRLEEIDLLQTVSTNDPQDASALYYLGNLYYFLEQKEKGLHYWEKAVEKNPRFAQAYRNLGFGYSRQNEPEKAVASYEKAIDFTNQDPRFFQELDLLYEKIRKPAGERLTFLEKNLQTVLKHDEAVIRLLTLLNETGAYDRAIDLMASRHFHVWEGGGEIHDLYVDSHLLKGMDLFASGQYKEAVKEFEKADLYPENLEVGRPETGGHNAKGYYYMGKAYRALGNRKKAEASFAVAARNVVRRRENQAASENTLFKALALKEIGQKTESEEWMRQLDAAIDSQLAGQGAVDAYSKFGEDGSRTERLARLYYLKGLRQCMDGQVDSGKALLRQAIDTNPNLIWARQFLNHAF